MPRLQTKVVEDSAYQGLRVTGFSEMHLHCTHKS